MTHQDERELIRLLLGELGADERRRVEGRLEREEELLKRFAALRSGWEALEEAPFPGVSPGFQGGVMAAARRWRENELSWSAAPVWVRAGTAAALVLGIGLGVGVGQRGEPQAVDSALAQSSTEIVEPLSLAETFWMGFEDDATTGGEETP